MMILQIFLLCLLFIGFQNCNPSVSIHNNTISSKNNSGVPYDGKLFIIHGELCSDGSTIQSTLLIRTDGSGQLLRDHCTDITPMDISAAEITIVDGQSLVFRNTTYLASTDLLKLSPLTTWNYQLINPLVQQSAKVFDIDMFNTNSQEIQSLKNQGYVVICYISVGSYEDFRPDANQFNSNDLGNVLGGGSADRWLDTRSATVRAIMLQRLDLAKANGCDGVDLDNVDAFSSNSGFPLTTATQIEYNRYLANASHDRGLIVGLNNVAILVNDLINHFDFVVAEQCFQSGECQSYSSFITAGKAVFDVEYTGYSQAQCDQAKTSQISLVFLNKSLDGTNFNSCP